MSNQNQQATLAPEAFTNAQIGILLQTAGTMMGMLLNPPREIESVPGSGHQPPPEARIAAENTFMAVCDRIESIIKDDSRWNMDFYKRTVAQNDEVHKQHLGFLNAQSAASRELVSPHFRFRPNLQRMPDMSWTAYLGDLGEPNSVIAGVGRTPAEALYSFDEIFHGRVPPHMVEWILQHEKAMNAGQPSPPVPKPPSYEEPPMDSRRSNPAKRPKKGRKDHS